METESEHLLRKIAVLDNLLETVEADTASDRGELKRAVENLRADDVRRLKDLDDDERVP